jgi:hypothetical protein
VISALFWRCDRHNCSLARESGAAHSAGFAAFYPIKRTCCHALRALHPVLLVILCAKHFSANSIRGPARPIYKNV